MAIERIIELPVENNPVAGAAVPIDGLTTRQTTIQKLVDAGAPVASQAEAEAGIQATKRMTPLTTAQAVAFQGAALFASSAEGALAATSLQPADIGVSVASAAEGDLAVSAMQPAEYDPTGVNGDAFAMANMTGTASTAQIADAAVTNAKLAAVAVGTTNIIDAAVTAGKLGALAVTTAKIDAEAVTAGKLGALAVTTAKIDTDAVTNVKLSNMATATIKGRNTAGAGDPEDLTAAQAINILDPSSQILQGEGLKLTYHKARQAWHVRSFGSSLTDVGAGNAAVDNAALQAAMSAGVTVDITGVTLTIDDEISVINESAKIGASHESRQPAGVGSSIINITDNALPVLFRVGHDNFEASGFSVRSTGATNETTTAFWFERTVDTYRDIDARLINVGMSILGRGVYHKGRGLETSGCLFSELYIAGIEVDQPATWTPRGSASIDGIDTGTRGYRFNLSRAHALQAPFFKNTGTYALNIGGVEINGLIADVGADGGLIQGVVIDMQATDIQCRYSGFTGSRMLELQPGSRNSSFVNFNAVGYIGASGNRLSNHAVRMTSSAANPIQDISFIGGSIGPTLQAGVNLLGDGAYTNIVFSGVTWKGIGQAGTANLSPIQVASTVPSTVIKLIGTHGRDNFASEPFLQVFNTPANNTLIREVSATKDGSFSGWATSGVVVTTNERLDGSVSLPTYTFDADLDTGFWRAGSGITGYSANGTEVSRFTATTQLWGRTSNTTTTAGVGAMVTPAGPFINTFSSGTGSSTHQRFYNDAGATPTQVGSISTNASATAFNTSSDVRLKQDFKPIDPALLEQIKVYDFEWKVDGSRSYGVKAQELVEYVPGAVHKGETEGDMWAVDYSKLVPLLIASVKDLRERLAVIEAEAP